MDQLEAEALAYRVAAGIRRIARELEAAAFHYQVVTTDPLLPTGPPRHRPPGRCCGSALDLFGMGTMAAKWEAEHARAMMRAGP